jgi:hypothetical protein
MAKVAQSVKGASILDEISDVAEVDLNEVMKPSKDAGGRPNYRFGLSAKGDDVFVDCADRFRLVRAKRVIKRQAILTAIK